MGHGAQATRKNLIEHVKACIDAANDATALADDVRKANNTNAEQTKTAVDRLDGRLDTLGAWCARLEKQVQTGESADARVSLLRSEVHELFAKLTFRERFRWFFFGEVPRLNVFAGHIATPPPALVDRAARRRNEFSEAMVGGVRPSAGMAPRPLP